jgi:hypothetical protein
MKKFVMIATLLALVFALVVPLSVQADSVDACFGLVAAAYGKAGIQGEHASSFAGEPRIGLANLAVFLYEQGTISEPTMTALGIWLNQVEQLNIAVCEVE